MMEDNKKPEFTEEQMKEVADQFYRSFVSMCRHCAHEKVCKLTETPGETCKEFLNSGNYKRYGNIYDLFTPIFNWLEYHYPAGEVKFVVDKKSAVMYLEHGVKAYSKAVAEVLPPDVQAGYEQQKEGEDTREQIPAK